MKCIVFKRVMNGLRKLVRRNMTTIEFFIYRESFNYIHMKLELYIAFFGTLVNGEKYATQPLL